jgi:hypothetical protein
MSYAVEACLAYKGTLEELKSAVEKVLGLQLPHSERHKNGNIRAFYGSLLTIDLELSINYLETDRDLNFSDFQYLLSTRTGAGYNFRHRLLELQLPITNTMGLLLCYHLGIEVMVTVEGQELYARYDPDKLKEEIASGGEVAS